jgi:hypothetical protein
MTDGIEPDNADFLILSLADEKGKFALPVLAKFSPEVRDALERGFDGDWFRLLDVSLIADTTVGEPYRIFRLTPAGRARLAELSKTRLTS